MVVLVFAILVVGAFVNLLREGDLTVVQSLVRAVITACGGFAFFGILFAPVVLYFKIQEGKNRPFR